VFHLTQVSSPFFLQDFIKHFLDSKKAQDIVSIDLQGKSSMADYLIIASGASQRQVGSLAELLRTDLKKKGVKSVRIEGIPQCDWVLVDAGDVIVHIFRPEVRAFYNLEKMWGLEISENTPEPIEHVILRSLEGTSSGSSGSMRS
jgi:ribosome-associated protein